MDVAALAGAVSTAILNGGDATVTGIVKLVEAVPLQKDRPGVKQRESTGPSAIAVTINH